MKIRIYVSFGNHQRATGEALRQGFAKHGVLATVHSTTDVRPCELAVFWGHRKHRIIQEQKRTGNDYLVMERAYFGDRYKYVSLGFNGLNGHADFHNEGMPGDRWEKHQVTVAPWKEGGEYVLLAGQCMGDCSLGSINYPGWLKSQIKAINGQTMFRPHPLGRPIRLPVPFTNGTTLEHDLSRAKALVTYNSNSAVDAVLLGVPAVTHNKGSMAWDVTSRSVDNLIRPDRTQWLHDLAYCQWLPDEIASGEAWAHLKRRYE